MVRNTLLDPVVKLSGECLPVVCTALGSLPTNIPPYQIRTGAHIENKIDVRYILNAISKVEYSIRFKYLIAYPFKSKSVDLLWIWYSLAGCPETGSSG